MMVRTFVIIYSSLTTRHPKALRMSLEWRHSHVVGVSVQVFVGLTRDPCSFSTQGSPVSHLRYMSMWPRLNHATYPRIEAQSMWRNTNLMDSRLSCERQPAYQCVHPSGVILPCHMRTLKFRVQYLNLYEA